MITRFVQFLFNYYLTNKDPKKPKQIQKMSLTYIAEKPSVASDSEDQDRFRVSSQPRSSLQTRLSDGSMSLFEPVAPKKHLRKRQLSVR